MLECGLGGRLDSTNVVKNVACAAITSIGYDHQKILGHKFSLQVFEIKSAVNLTDGGVHLV